MGRTLQESLDSFGKTLAERESAKIYQFPLWGEVQRGIPNDFARSALFTARKGTGKEYIEDQLLFAQQGIELRYNGPRLTQDHLDVFEAIMHLAREMPEGNTVKFTAHGLLKLLNRATGKANYDRLLRTLKALTATAVVIKSPAGTYCGSLLPEWGDRDNKGRFSVKLNRALCKYFAGGFTVIEWQQRKSLARRPLAQALHVWLCSHDRPHAVTVQYLHDITGSNTKQLWKFRQSLKAALAELVNVGVLADWRIDESDKVHFVKS